jgi:hypothetical protein
MPFAQEKWTRIDTPVTVETPRKTYRVDFLFVSPGGVFIPTGENIARGTQITVNFSIENQAVRAQAEIRRCMDPGKAKQRGIHGDQAGWEMRIVRMEGDGSQILADHIKKILMESGGPTGL